MQAAIGEELGSLSRLHTLSLHLDSPDYPVCCPDLGKIGMIQVTLTDAQINAEESALRSQADLLASSLSRSVRLLRLVERDTEGAAWRTYRLSRVGSTDDAVYARHDRSCSTQVSLRVVGPPILHACSSSDAVHSISSLICSWTC